MLLYFFTIYFQQPDNISVSVQTEISSIRINKYHFPKEYNGTLSELDDISSLLYCCTQRYEEPESMSVDRYVQTVSTGNSIKSESTYVNNSSLFYDVNNIYTGPLCTVAGQTASTQTIIGEIQ